jgi:hypothetical protein
MAWVIGAVVIVVLVIVGFAIGRPSRSASLHNEPSTLGTPQFDVQTDIEATDAPPIDEPVRDEPIAGPHATDEPAPHRDDTEVG